ncbi:hypothetical protein J2Z21_008023 [Streptomyces griseochromogenes]|uniref:Band 7 domain-containing protein n=1 Tax=Streptomyces griseochromogenes TaxID=68214 RepID=A0A1B1B4E9_9ACTN|nr:hypothetical protein [Streptomyces griseochromogenes]ANP53698.1 hypothetical protein AVL59_32810 [Streptomyces griseochromogenes]MBP2055011.1 hypothetical protein [Streptomyces griseochromogenes]
MEEQTYDPVLSSDDVPKWRLVNPLRPPAPGRALVLVRDSGPSLTIRSGEEIPSSRFGAYRTVFTIDMTEHRLILDIPLLSRDPTFSFRSRVDLVCRVAAPAEVVARGIRDMSGALYGYLRKTLRSVARDYDIAEFHEAEMALNAALAGFSGDDAVRLRNIQIELLVDEDEIAASGREFRDVVRETRLEGMRRKRHRDMIREEGIDGLIAGIMEKEGPRAALAWIEKREAEKHEIRREVMRMVLERGDADREPFEQAELERAVLEEVLRDGDGLFETATRRGRLRGTLARALEPGSDDRDAAPDGHEDERAPLRGEVLRDRYGDGADRPPTGARPRDEDSTPRSRLSGSGSRLSGSAAPAEPPEDEPLPGSRDGWATTGSTEPRSGGAAGHGDGRGPAHPWRKSAAGPSADGARRVDDGDGGPDDGHRTGGRPGDRETGDRAVGGRTGSPADDDRTERRTGDTAPRVSRVRGTAKKYRPDTSGSDGERR